MILRYFELAALWHSSHFEYLSIPPFKNIYKDHKKFALALHLQVKEVLCVLYEIFGVVGRVQDPFYYYKTIES